MAELENKMAGGPGSVRLKLLLLILALLIGASTLIYTHRLVVRLQEKEQQTVQLYAKGLQYVANSSSESGDITFLFENIIRPIDFPMILTDPKDSIGNLSNSNIRNIKFDSSLAKEKLYRFFSEKIKEMDQIHPPIHVNYVMGKDTILLTKIHYGDSTLITQLRYYPYIQIVAAAFFFIIGYIGFSQIKKSEQGNIWVGMSKETAHQFGTPISSLMGWLELLKIHYADPDKVQDITEEIGNDVEKLHKITNRFSKIGSKTELKQKVVADDIKKTIEYFKRRLPQTGKNVQLTLAGDISAKAMINSGLFEWVIENLVKNALDAIQHENGRIDFYVTEYKKNVEIEITDNGKGIDMKYRKDIFRPGYSTKRRGWGLGLSLTKRIVEDYHKGRIFVKNSIAGEGTTFKIILRKS